MAPRELFPVRICVRSCPEVLSDPELPHPDEVVFAAPAGSVMIYNAYLARRNL
jgi:hypothetical protein